MRADRLDFQTLSALHINESNLLTWVKLSWYENFTIASSKDSTHLHQAKSRSIFVPLFVTLQVENVNEELRRRLLSLFVLLNF